VTLLERTAGAGDEGRRVDIVLAGWLAEPRSRSQERLLAGEVAADGRPVAKSHRVRAGEHFAVTAPAEVVEPAEALPEVAVRWRDDHLAVVAKPAGLVVHEGAGVRGTATLVAALQAAGLPLSRAGDPERPGIVHRLDRGTSGLLAVALSDEAFVGLTALLRGHDVEREYAAIVDGVPEAASATIDAPIARDPASRTRFAVAPIEDPSARAAITHYDVVEAFGRAALLAVRLETGRTHQVRVHLSAIDHPVAGDRAYGASPVLADELGLERPALHARRLAFDHPVTGERVDVSEPEPADLAAALAVLRHPGR